MIIRLEVLHGAGIALVQKFKMETLRLGSTFRTTQQRMSEQNKWFEILPSMLEGFDEEDPFVIVMSAFYDNE